MNESQTAYYDQIAGNYLYISVSEKAGEIKERRHKSLGAARGAARSFVLEKKDGKWTRA